MRSFRLLAPALFAAAVVPLACDLGKTAEQLTADKVMIATLLSTPPVEIRPSFLNPDGGFGDAGIELDGGLELDGGVGLDGGFGVTIPAQTVAFVFFGARTSQSLDSPPSAIDNATVTLRPSGAANVTLENQGGGNYGKNTQEDESFQYQSGATYDFVATLDGTEYVGRVEQVPQLERIDAFHPGDGFVEHPANTPFSFSRPAPPANQERNLGFVTVLPIGDEGEKGDPTYSNIPSTPLDFLKLIALPGTYKTDTVTLPGSAFPNVDQTYLVIFQSVKSGGPESENLFTGSALLAGTAEVGIFRTK